MKVTEINSSEISNEISDVIVKNINTDGDAMSESKSSSSAVAATASFSSDRPITDKKRVSDSFFYDHEISKKMKFHNCDPDVIGHDEDGNNNNNGKKSESNQNSIIVIGEKLSSPEVKVEVEVEVESAIEGSNVNQNNYDNIEDEQIDQKEEESEDEEEEEEDGEEIFFKALKEFEGRDIEALKAFISSSEM